MRYCRQRCGTRCGPVALLNLAKWRGERVTYRDISRFEKECGWSRQAGTPVSNMARFIGSGPHRLGFGQFKRHLERGGVVLLWIDESDEPESHYCLAIGIKDGRYMLVNYCPKHMPCRQTPRRMAYLLRHGKGWMFK